MENGSGRQRSSWVQGFGLTVLIAFASQFISFRHTALDPLIISILISIVLGNLIGPVAWLEPGIILSRRIFIPIGIILYGTQMDFEPLRVYGSGRLVHIFFMVFAGLGILYALASRLGISKKISLLLAAGSVVCGASAIMVLSPVIEAEKEDTSISLLAITVVGLTGVILFPLVQEVMALPEDVYALLCGSTLNQMGQVRAAAALAGQNVLDMAVPIKLLRIGTLLPIAVLYSFIRGRKKRKIYIPWFIAGSVIVALFSNLFPPPGITPSAVAPLVTFFFSIAISGIGLSVNLESLIDVGPKPLLAGFLGWLVLIVLFIIGLEVVG